jgi:predicted protein tyrosine phosphatase
MFESQSKTVSLLQLSVPQVPLFLQPAGEPPVEVEQLAHAIIYVMSRRARLKFLKRFVRKDSIFWEAENLRY